MASRQLSDLLPPARRIATLWDEACARRGVNLLIYCTWRTAAEQGLLWAVGRTIPGRRKTNARPWESMHQYRCAWDAVPAVFGKPDWSYADINNDQQPDEQWWQVAVEEAERLGIEWAGRWRTFREYCHWQYTGGLSKEELKQACINAGLDLE